MEFTVIEGAQVHTDGMVRGLGEQYAYEPGEGRRNLLHVLRELGVDVPNACGGNGRCGKCRVVIPEKTPEPADEDKAVFSQRELEMGYRLACRHELADGMVIAVPAQSSEDMQILGLVSREGKPGRPEGSLPNERDIRIAIDLGTTTIAAAMLVDGRAVDSISVINHQSRYGADVISRIKASMEGQGEALRQLVQEDLLSCMEKLCVRQKVEIGLVREIVIAGNTTMLHLLLGYPCDGLGKAPFHPVTLELGHDNFEAVFGDRVESTATVVLLPGFSAYVGADIVSGLYSRHLEEQEKKILLVDLGTNGEMALGNRQKLYVTSTAAGPAFEGGNLSCGACSIPGAICHVGEDGISTIGDRAPIGLCGTGVIEAMAYMRRKGILDENGLLQGDYFETGYSVTGRFGPQIVITQEDIRQVQMAKAAIRAGIEILCLRSGIRPEEIDELQLAGGFGYYLDPKAAVAIGMLPDLPEGRICAVGNASLEGAVRFAAADRKAADRDGVVTKIAALAEEISLAEDPLFEEKFMEYMAFR